MRSISLAVLLALTACNDDGAGGTGTSGSTGATDDASASATIPTTSSGDATTASSGPTTGDPDTTAGPGSSEGGESTTTGSDATTTASSGPDDTTGTGTTGADADPVGAVGPKWLRRFDGLVFDQHVATLPDGDVVALLNGGLYAKQIVVAQDDADEVVLSSMFTAPALARFDGASGALEEARMLAKLGQGAPYGMSARPHQLAVAGNGDLLVAGTWAGLVEFFPGTADSATLLAEMKLNGNMLDRAEEPFFFRMTPTGAVTWLVRGKTPSGLQMTWFNYGLAIAALPGDDVVIAGDYEASGFVVAHGTPNAKTMVGALDSYFARLDAGGSPVWAHRNSDQLPFHGLESGADGALYTQLYPDATIFADGDAPTMTMSEPGLATGVVGRIAPDGGLEWTANVAAAGSSPLRHLAVASSGDVVVYGEVEGELLVRDAGGVVMNTTTDTAQAWVAGLGPTGEGLWIRALGPAVTTYGPALAGDDGVWLVARIVAPHELEVAGQPTPLPALGYAGEATVLLRIGAGGEVDAVQVVGADLPIASLAWSGPDQASFILLGDYYCDSTQPFVVDAAGDGLDPLPIGCEMEPLDDSRGYVAAIPRAR